MYHENVLRFLFQNQLGREGSGETCCDCWENLDEVEPFLLPWGHTHTELQKQGLKGQHEKEYLQLG